MQEALATQPDYAAVVRSWQRRAPWARRLLARMGIQGKLIAIFLTMLAITRATSCWFFHHEAQRVFENMGACPQGAIALHHAETTSLVINVAASLLLIPIILLILHRLFEPIRTLVAAADKIASGDLDTRVAIYRPDAIGTLARSFNKMAHKLRSHEHSLQNANDRLAEANRDLEERVEQRTSELEAAISRLNMEIAEKEDFVRAISNDLSAPLRNISGMTAMLLRRKRDNFDDEVVHRLQRIQKNVEVESALIGELLELSKIKTRRQRMENVDLNDLVREVAGVFEGDLQSRGIQFIVDSTLPILRCEKPRLRQLFQNLIDNAVKYMGDGMLHPPHGRLKQIRVGSATCGEDVSFYVHDTGMGIEPDDLETIFYIFRRGRSAAVRSIAGKGVGLASVKSIIETYRGNIRVESEVGRGSTFRFTINGTYLVESRELAGAK
ncbi:MAG TPA: ATP-binding protein [Tepidisphaeraceae bacterium]|nr:ATP-binding protein [Tepidisphaeraceae bacterium]